MPSEEDDFFPVVRVKRAGDRERGIQNWHYLNKTMDFSQVQLSPMAEAYMKKVENNPADIIHAIGSFALLPETTAFSAGAKIGTVGKIKGITAFPANRFRGFDLEMEPIPVRASEEVAAPALADPMTTKSYPLEAAAAAMAPDPGSSAFMMAEEDTSVLEELVRITRGSERETWREALRQTRERQRVEREGTSEDIEMIERPGLRRRLNRERGDTEETEFMEEVAQETNTPRPRGRKGKRPLKTSTPKKGRSVKKGRVVSAEEIGGGEYSVTYERLETPLFRRGGAELRSGARAYEDIELADLSDIVIDEPLPDETVLEDTSLTALLPESIEQNIPVRGPRLEMYEVRMGRGVPVANRSGKIVELPWAREARLAYLRKKFRSTPSSLLPHRGGGRPRPRPIPIPPRPKPKPKPKPTPIPPKPTPKPKPKPKPIKRRVRFADESEIITKKKKRKIKHKKKKKVTRKRKLRRRRK